MLGGQTFPYSPCRNLTRILIVLDQGQGQGRLRMIGLSEVNSPQMQIKPLSEQLQLGGDMVKAQAEVLGQVAEKIQVQVTRRDPEHPLDPIRPATRIRHLSKHEILILRSLSPPVVAEGPGPVVSQELSSPLPYFQHQRHRSAAKMPMPVLRVYADQETSTEEESRGCERRYRAWRGWELGYGRQKVWEETQGQAGQTARQTDERNERKKEGAKVEETAKEGKVEEPIKEKMFVTTGRLTMPPVRARLTQHD